MKKIAITLAAVAAFGVAACTPAADEAANNVTDIEATDNEANFDVNVSANDAAIDAAGNTIDDLGNAADDLGNAADNAATDLGNAAE